MDVIYNNNQIINNEFLKVSETQNKPTIILNVNNNKNYLIILYDPDAINGTYIHWIVSDIKNSNIIQGKNLVSYEGPAPPAKTGKHRYIFELYNQENQILNRNFERNISIENLRSELSLHNPINRIQFISQNESGGKRSKTRNKRIKKSRKTRRRRY